MSKRPRPLEPLSPEQERALKTFLEIQVPLVKGYVHVEFSRSCRRYLRQNMPWYSVIVPKWIQRRIKSRLRKELLKKISAANSMLKAHLLLTKQCIASPTQQSLSHWKRLSVEIHQKLCELRLCYAVTSGWNILFTLDLVSDDPILSGADTQ